MVTQPTSTPINPYKTGVEKSKTNMGNESNMVDLIDLFFFSGGLIFSFTKIVF